MLTTVIIILREFLEAALLVSLLAALHVKYRLYRRWMMTAVLPGIIGAYFYAQSFASISEWFDGSGQEIINSLSLLCIALCLGFQILRFSFLYRKHEDNRGRDTLLSLSAILIIIMAIAREGAEIFVYYSSININPDKTSSMLTGGIIGAGLGVCTGILTFVLLYQLSLKNLMFTTSVLLVLMCAGLLAEATQSLIQAGLIVTGEPLWNSSGLIAESSVTGQLLYAVFAYEATPTRAEILMWLLGALSLSCLLIWIHCRKQPLPQK